MKPQNHGNYLKVSLTAKNGKIKQENIHRLVALAFIENPNNLPFVNHKDEDKHNNNVDNLEWCDAKYNNTYGTRIVKAAQTLKESQGYKDIIQMDLEGKVIAIYPSRAEAQRQTGV